MLLFHSEIYFSDKCNSFISLNKNSIPHFIPLTFVLSIYTMLTVSGLFIYPIKSLGGIAVSSALVTDRGLQYDRRWMLVNEQNYFLTQRELPAMALLQVAVLATGLQVTHKFTQASVHIPFQPETSATIMTDVWSDRCRAQIVSYEINEWFSNVLNSKCKLVFMPENTRRRVDGRYAFAKEINSFSDGFPTLIIGQSSLDDLNSRLAENFPMQRFRPNIVFTGGAPYEEDELEEFTINKLPFFGVKLCARCVITTINPATAEKGKEPLRTLATYRMKNNRIYFGQNLLHKGEGVIHIGDAIEVVQRKIRAKNFINTLD